MTKTLKLIALASVATFALSACGSSTTTETAAPEVSETAKVGFSPISGLPGGSGGPIAVVKIDNVNPARPQWGLSAADMIFVEEVEAGLTRIAAVFNSSMPNKVGPVRSARISDLEILEQFDNPGFAYSGANKALLPKIATKPLVRLGPSLNGAKYSRDSSRRIPHNLMLDLASTVKKAKAVMKKTSDVALMDVPNTSIFGFSLVNKNPKYKKVKKHPK